MGQPILMPQARRDCCPRAPWIRFGESGSLRAQLTKEAAVVGPDVLFDDAALLVEPEDVHQVHDDALPIGVKGAGWRGGEGVVEGALINDTPSAAEGPIR